MLGRKRFVAAVSTALLLSGLCFATHAQPAKEIRVALQKGGILAIAKQRGVLEEEFKRDGIAIKWYEFATGIPVLEALNSDKLDFGSAGSAPPIFAQAARENLLYVASQPAGLNSEGILVRNGAGIAKLEDLKGKRIGVAKGTSGHHFLLAALDKAGLRPADVKIAYLAPADATAAFGKAELDAWVVWDPFLAIGEKVHGAQVLTKDVRVVHSNNFLLANKEFSLRNPALLKRIVDRLSEVGRWAEDNRPQLAQLLTDQTGIPLDIERTVVGRGTFAIKYMDDAVTQQQQELADRLAELAIVPKRVEVRHIVWKPTDAR